MRTSLKSLKNIVTISKSKNSNPVGRWIVYDDDVEKKFLRAAQATTDSCGDRLCGDPVTYSKLNKK